MRAFALLPSLLRRRLRFLAMWEEGQRYFGRRVLVEEARVHKFVV